MKKLILIFLLQAAIMTGYSQYHTRWLSFMAYNNETHVYLDSVKIYRADPFGFDMDTMVIWPDTAGYFTLLENTEYLYLGYSAGVPVPVGIKGPEERNLSFSLSDCYPNPTSGKSRFSLTVPQYGDLSIQVSDLLGRPVLSEDYTLDHGSHHFTFCPGLGTAYILTATWNGERQGIRIIAMNPGAGQCSLEYAGYAVIQDLTYKSLSVDENPLMESGILDVPDSDTTYTFQFASNIPCPGTPTVDYEGKVYNTVQIFSQCWLKENLDVGIMKLLWEDVTDNCIIEKRCYNDDPDSCTRYGGLYFLGEGLQYDYNPGARGICPPGWHVPTDLEWIVLEGLSDSFYPVDDPVWFLSGEDVDRGWDAGIRLKSSSGWIEGNGSDDFGFSALPGGYIAESIYHPYYEGVGSNGSFISSKSFDPSYLDNYSYYRNFKSYMPYNGNIIRSDFPQGASVRCIKGDSYPGIEMEQIELTFSAENNGSYVQLDSVRIYNIETQGCDKLIVFPDTTVIIPDELKFSPGDKLALIGYHDSMEAGLLDAPDTNETYLFEFATNIPCPETPTVEYGGQVYNTIQIFNQCWLKENLNIGTMIEGANVQWDNGTIEKYCYDNSPDSCAKYGGLYQWGEMMQYSNLEGAQGICPPGWHIPSDKEWALLEGAADSYYGIEYPDWWYGTYYRGYDAGKNLKTISGWTSNNGSDLFGFSALPGGRSHSGGEYLTVLGIGYFWTSDSQVIFRSLEGWTAQIVRTYYGAGGMGLSVRCLRDD